jgi:hypothetical protein
MKRKETQRSEYAGVEIMNFFESEKLAVDL